MSAIPVQHNSQASISRLAGLGATAGLGGGVIFGAMMAMGGMLPMVAMLAGSESAAVGFVVHMLISAFIGAVYGVIAGRLPLTLATAIIGGVINGVVWWVLGALVLMPLFLGMNEMIFQIGGPQWMSLVGHILYGLVSGLAFFFLARR